MIDFLPSLTNVGMYHVDGVDDLFVASCIVYYLLNSIRKHIPRHDFNVYTDNYYSSTRLFNKLRKERIGACGVFGDKFGDFS